MGLFGGDSTTNQKTDNFNIDQKLMLEAGATGVSASGGSVVNMLDGGTIKQAFGMGNHAIDSVTDFATSALSGAHHTAELALSGALSTVNDTKQAFQDAAAQVATAYEESKIGNRSALMMGAIALGVVGLVVVSKKARA